MTVDDNLWIGLYHSDFGKVGNCTIMNLFGIEEFVPEIFILEWDFQEGGLLCTVG